MEDLVQKQTVSNMCSVAIIYRVSKPDQIFIEIKDDGYPMKRFRRSLCLIGGNWIGPQAKNDFTTRRTLEREIGEELSLDKGTASTVELGLLGFDVTREFYVVPKSDLVPTDEDLKMLSGLKERIVNNLIHFGDFVNVTPKWVLDEADPENKRDGSSAVCSYWTAGLDESDWADLATLQKRFGNLSNESVTLITSLDELIKTKREVAFGHDQPLQRFFRSRGLKNADEMAIVKGVTSTPVPKQNWSYDEYMKYFDVQKKPV